MIDLGRLKFRYKLIFDIIGAGASFFIFWCLSKAKLKALFGS
jgi:hypothetical protein